MKYNDNKYHVEYRIFDYMGGYSEPAWTVVNVYGEICTQDDKQLCFNSKESAEHFCMKANICNDGGLCTNFT